MRKIERHPMADQIISQLIEARKTKGIRRVDIASRTGSSENAIYYMETNQADPMLSNVCRYAESIGMELRLCEKE